MPGAPCVNMRHEHDARAVMLRFRNFLPLLGYALLFGPVVAWAILTH